MSAGPWTLTTRAGPRVEHERLPSLDEALAALERRVAQLESSAAREEVRFFRRRIAPVELVAARLELAGPGGRGGIDVRGDGTLQAYTGRVRRAVVERRGGETAVAALRRALAP